MAPNKKNCTLEVLIKQRMRISENLQRIADIVMDKDNNLSSEELECRLEIIETYFTQALELQSHIEELDNAGENINSFTVRGHLEDLYCSVKSCIRALLKNSNSQQTIAHEQKKSSFSGAFEHLPKLKLPTFSGKYTEFHNFIRLFKTLVHDNSRLSVIEKFNHLHSCLTGPALRTIKALDFTEENYHKALTLLETRFDNKYLTCQEHITELFKLNKIQKDSAEQLRYIIDTVTAHFNSLVSLLSYEEITNSLIVHIVMAALDNESQQKIEESVNCAKTLTWSDCTKILVQRCQILETREGVQGDKRQKQNNTNKQGNKSPKSFVLAAAKTYCNCCKQDESHPLWKCAKFLEWSPLQRFEFTKKSGLCINCFSSEHSLRQCKSSTCKQCHSSHHTLLHRNSITSSNSLGDANLQQQGTVHTQHQLSAQQYSYPTTSSLNPTTSSFKPTPSSFNPPTGDNAAAFTMVGQQIEALKVTNINNNPTILATALIKITDRYGNQQTARALLDSASQLNFITQGYAQFLQLDKWKTSTVIGGIGQSQTTAKFSTTVQINSLTTNFTTSLQCLILPSITGLQPFCKINTNAFNIPQDLQLADPEFHLPQKVDVLIGAELFFELFDGKQIKLGKGCPKLMHTVLGWIVSGKCSTHQPTVSLLSNLSVSNSNEHLDDLVKQFWSVERVPDTNQKLSKEQSECETYFQKTTKRLQSGRFEVRLPFKQHPTTLGDSKQIALKRFYNLEKRLAHNPQLKQAYSEFLLQYEAENHMTPIEWPLNLNGHYIMPHHAVLRPDKSTTKCRVVFDASSKTTNNLALNDILMVGPVVQNELVEILWRFRLHQYGLMADVTAMYRQINVNKDDCKVQNIIWRKSPTDQLQLYQLNTVTFGTASAPYLATRCLVQLAEDHSQTSPLMSSIIKRDFYVDDLITGGSSYHELATIKHELTNILAKAGFRLHKWFSNDQIFLSELSIDEREKTMDLNNAPVVKTLGIIWDANNDSFRFNYTVNENNTDCITKRQVLSEMSRLFDPLGLIKPITVKAKIFLQELWLKNLTWDENIPNECATSWIQFLSELKELSQLQIPRYVLLVEATIQLHGFSDASTRAYGCCFYIRCVDSSGNIKITLFTSRSRVAPISTTRSLPCLELCGAHLLTQLFNKIRNITHFNDIFFWSDSTIVLHWLAEHSSRFNTFVANRVSFIQEHTAGLSWKYVPSKQNPDI